MKNMNSLKRKCSVALAAGAGAAVCLTGGGPAQAGFFVSGNIAASNGTTVFNGGGGTLKAFGPLAAWFLNNTIISGRITFSWKSGSGLLNRGTIGAYAVAHPAGVTVSAGIFNGFNDFAAVPSNVSDKYFAVCFVNPATRYGWLHVVSSNATGSSVTMDKWGYETTGASCKTLPDSIASRKLSLADGRVQLHWTNANEDGVARYEVQTRDASGTWQPVDSDTPGEGRYTTAVPADADCRLVVEKVDGTAEAIAF